MGPECHSSDIVNYMLFLHAMKHNYDDARKLYDEAIRLMTKRGPDLPIILYGYAIFLCATGEEDWATIAELIWRARQADTDGESFKFAVMDDHYIVGYSYVYIFVVPWLLPLESNAGPQEHPIVPQLRFMSTILPTEV